MGIRFNSGAIPVAVILMQHLHCIFRIYIPLFRALNGKVSENQVSQKTCLLYHHSTLSGEKQECKVAARYFIFLLFPNLFI
jgi:hypothetical protein